MLSNIKKELIIGIISITAVLVLTVSFVVNFNKSPIPVSKLEPGASSDKKNESLLTVEVVKKHNTETDCWLIIENKVYDTTNYLHTHPGGRNQIIPYCGADATQAFATQGGKGSHSSSAQTQLASLYIGDLNGQAINQTNPIVPLLKKDKEKKEEDDD